MRLFRICFVLTLFSCVCSSVEEVDQQKRGYTDVVVYVVKDASQNEIIESKEYKLVDSGNALGINAGARKSLSIYLQRLPKNWFSHLLDVFDPWFMFHLYEPEYKAASPNNCTFAPNWTNAFVRMIDPYYLIYPRALNMEVPEVLDVSEA